MTTSESPLVLSKRDFPPPYDWPTFVNTLRAGHLLPKAQLQDAFLGPKGKSLLSRAAWIDGIGYGVKSVTVIADNPNKGLPSVQDGMLLLDGKQGNLRAVLDNDLITDIKTAADSVLGAQLLANKAPRTHLILGAGAVAKNIVLAYQSHFPSLDNVLIWNRTSKKAKVLADQLCQLGVAATAVETVSACAGDANIISTATMSSEPVLKGEWVACGTHVDLIGAFRADMREADYELLAKGRLFVDNRDSTIHHIGEIAIPLANGIITETDIHADFYELVAGYTGRKTSEDITIFKNGGGAHLDLMIANAFLSIAEIQKSRELEQ